MEQLLTADMIIAMQGVVDMVTGIFSTMGGDIGNLIAEPIRNAGGVGGFAMLCIMGLFD